MDVAATWEASFLITNEGRLFVCGVGAKGELGLGHEKTTAARPVEISCEGCRFSTVTSSFDHVTVNTWSNVVLGWGNSKRGQLGAKLRDVKTVWQPTQISEAPEKGAIVAGKDFTIFPQTAALELFGQNRFLKSEDLDHLRSDVKDEDSAMIASWNTVFTLTKDGQVRAVGRNDRGQKPSADLPTIAALAAGSEHCVALLPDCTIIAWGWGEHGNCGANIDSRGNVMDRWNLIPFDAKARGVAAGCATSFILEAKTD